MSIDLYQECADIVSQVPKGMVTTYGTVARALGDEIAKRAVGVMLNTYSPPVKMPCHRVVYSGGGLGGFAYGLPSKIKMLAEEGVKVKDDKIYNFENIFFDDFKTSYPLRKARDIQKNLVKKVSLEDPGMLPNYVLGLDASYNGTNAFGAGVLYDFDADKPVKTYRTKVRISFPYVPTYLGFREIPVFREIISQVKEPAILMLDGNGTLHPLGFGIACHIGVEMGMPSIGVAKTKLCGSIDMEFHGKPTADARPIVMDGKTIGTELKTSARGKPIYVSPGHGLSADTALDIVKMVSRLKIPEPLRLAHAEATAMRRSES
jgi:deoxyribonuclease V